VFGIHDLNGEYFAYIDMKMKPEYIDVNVNPTKKEVHFLNERLIADKLKEDTEALLKENMNVKKFHTPILKQLSFDGNQVSSTPAAVSEAAIKKVSAVSMVRTDPKAQRLDKFFKQSEEKIGGVTITQISAVNFNTKAIVEEEDEDKMEIEEEKEEEVVKEKIVDERMMLINRIIEAYAKRANKGNRRGGI